MDANFRYYVVPVIVSKKWPYIIIIQSLGVGVSNERNLNVALKMLLRDVLGKHINVFQEDPARSHFKKPYPWT